MLTICTEFLVSITAFGFLSVLGQQATATYFIAQDPVNHSTAVRKCKSMNGSLVVISNDNIQMELQKKIQEISPGASSKRTIFLLLLSKEFMKSRKISVLKK